MNEISAFANSTFSCLKNLPRFELEDSCPASRLTDSKTANVAIIWIGLAGLAFVSFQLAKRLVVKKDPQMIQVFASNWQMMHPDKRYVPMNGLLTEKDCAHLQTIFQSWRLTSKFCFFDLLGAQMHRNWKQAEVEEDDLKAFGEICKDLSILLMANELHPQANFGSDVKKISKQIEALGNRLPNFNAPELKIFLAALSDPRKTQVLGVSAVELFEGSEMLDKGKSSRGDIDAFLQFAADMQPSFSTLLVPQDKKRLYNLNRLMTNIGPDAAEHPEALDRWNFLSQIKDLFEARIFEVKVPVFRLFENNVALEDLEELRQDDARWIERQYGRFLGNQYLDRLANVLTPSEGGLVQPDFSVRSEASIRMAFRLLAENCRMQGSLTNLEGAIVKRLRIARKNISDEGAYGNLFIQMVRLYQIVHDLRFIIDPSKNPLGANLFPSSLSSLAFLSSAPENLAESAPLPHPLSEEPARTSQNPEHASIKVSSREKPPSFEEEEETPTRRLPKIKTRRENRSAIESPPPDAPLPMIDEPERERPYFPPRPSPEQALHHLLENGFIIERVRGSHYQMKHVLTHTPTTIPLHGDRLKPGTSNSIRRAFYQSQGFDTSSSASL